MGAMMLDEGSELREGYAEIGDQRLHYVEAGDGPLIVLLHGFPEFWYGWRLQIQPLAAASSAAIQPARPVPNAFCRAASDAYQALCRSRRLRSRPLHRHSRL
jgi:pimeloyl-ACP methyl ester carboxylesterase